MQTDDRIQAMLDGMGPGAKRGMTMLRLVKFADVLQFRSGLRLIAEPLVAVDNDDLFATAAHASIAAGLDHGYKKNPAWFVRALDTPQSSIWGPVDMGRLCAYAERDAPECPLSILFGVAPEVVAACHVQSIEQVAGLARLAVAEVDAGLLATPAALYDAKTAPSWLLEDSSRFPAHRLAETFAEQEPLARLLECSDAEKFKTLSALMGVSQPSSAKLAALCVRATQAALPLHRVLQTYARCGDVEASLVLWDAPLEYLMATMGEK